MLVRGPALPTCASGNKNPCAAATVYCNMLCHIIATFDSGLSLFNPHMFTGVGSGGYAGDLTPPTIYVEGILICISPPLEKPNT